MLGRGIVDWQVAHDRRHAYLLRRSGVSRPLRRWRHYGVVVMGSLSIERTHMITWAQLEEQIGTYATMMHLISRSYKIGDFDNVKSHRMIEVDFIYQSEEKTIDDAWRDNRDLRREQDEETYMLPTVGGENG